MPKGEIMKRSKEEHFSIFLLSSLSLGLTSLLVTLSMVIGGVHYEQKEAKEEYSDDLNQYSSYDDLDEDEKEKIKKLEYELSILLNEKEYELDFNAFYEDYYVLSAITENENLNDLEKEEAYKLYKIIKDNPYLNKQEVYARLKTVKVDRKENSLKEETKKILTKDKAYVVASYRVNLNQILFYDYPNISNPTIRHELIHILFPCTNLPRCFAEGFAELLNVEYFNEEESLEENKVYYQEIAYVKLLCELLGSDKVLQIASMNDKDMLEEALMECFHDEKAVKRWMDVDKISEDHIFEYLSDLETILDKKKEKDEKQLKIFDLYYQLLFGKENDTKEKYFNIETKKEKVKTLN